MIVRVFAALPPVSTPEPLLSMKTCRGELSLDAFAMVAATEIDPFALGKMATGDKSTQLT
jgi:hypothetical protein